MTGLIFRVESALSTAHVHEPNDHKRNRNEKAEKKVDEDREWAGTEKDICEGSERDENQRSTAASEHELAALMSRESITNAALEGNPRSAKL